MTDHWNDGDDQDPFEDHWTEEVDEADWADVRAPMSTGRRVLLGLGALVAVLMLVGGGLFLWVQRQIDPPGPPGDESR